MSLPKQLQDLSDKIGLRGDWYYYRATWNKATKQYDFEYTQDGVVFHKGEHSGNTISIRYIGGPKNGTVEM